MPTPPTPEQDPLAEHDPAETEAGLSHAGEAAATAETPEELVFKKNLAAANERVAELLRSLQAERALQSLKEAPIPKAPKTATPTLRNLLAEDSRRKKTLLDGAAESFNKFRLERRGVQDTETFLVFQRYLEAHVEDTDFENMVIPTDKVEEKKKELEAQGCRINRVYPSYGKTGMSDLSFTRKKPFRVTRENTKPLSDLLGKDSDPLLVMELLRGLGFFIDGHTLNYNAEVLRDFIAEPHMQETLEKLSKLGVKTRELSFSRKDEKSGYPSGTVEEIEKIAKDAELLALLTDDVAANARVLVEETKVSVPLRADAVKGLARVAADRNAREALRALASMREISGLTYSAQALPFILRAHERGLLSSLVDAARVLDFSTLSSEVPFLKFLSYTATPEDIETSLDALAAECADGSLKRITTDAGFRDYAGQVTLLTEKLRITDLPVLEKIEPAKSESLALLALFSEAGVSLKGGLQYEAEAIAKITEDRALFARLLAPELLDFIRGFRKATGQSFSLYDFTPTRGGPAILQLYDNSETRTVLSAPVTVSVIKALGSFHANRVDTYQRLAAIEGVPHVIEELKAKFGYKPTESGYDYIPEEFLSDLAKDPYARDRFCSEPVVAFYNRLHADFRISFSSQVSHRGNLNLLAARANSEALEKQVFDPKNTGFIKRFAPRTVEDVYQLANVPEELRSVASALHENFSYRIGFSQFGAIGDEESLRHLAEDEASFRVLCAPDNAARIKRVQKCGYFPAPSVADLMHMSDIPPAVIDLIEALHTNATYQFSLNDRQIIEKYTGQSTALAALTACLRKYASEFKISEISWLEPLLPLDVRAVERELDVLRRHRPDFKFTPELSATVCLLVQKEYADADMKALDALYGKHAGDNRWIPYDIPKLILLRERTEVIETTHTALLAELEQSNVLWMNPISNAETLAKIHDTALIADIHRHKASPTAVSFILDNVERVGEIEPTKRSEFIEIALSIKESPSQEIKRLERELIAQLLLTKDPIGFYKKVEAVFIKNNLPTFGKIFKIFETLHTPKQIERSLSERSSSPVLFHASSRKRLMLMYQDLLQTHVRSGNRSLRRYAEVLRGGEALLSRAEAEGPEKLTAREREELSFLLAKCETLFLNSALGKHQPESAVAADLKESLKRLRAGLGVGEGESIPNRIAEMFLRPAGFRTLDEMLLAMQESKRSAHERGLGYAQSAQDGTLSLSEGDLLKGVDVRFIASILQNGSVAKEFLGAASSKDSTPLDTDVSRVGANDVKEGFRPAVHHSLAAGYGSLLIAIKNRGQFSVTRSEGTEHLEAHDPAKLELFETRVVGTEHFGIRTGFPSTEIDFLVADDYLSSAGSGGQELEKLYFEIAQNGYYIPVVDFDGRIIFTPEMYSARRRIFDGLERFDGDAYHTILLPRDGKAHREVQEIMNRQKNERAELMHTLQTIRSAVRDTLTKNGITLKSEFDSGLLGAEFIETGSIGRGTNLPGDYDFDFALKLDARDFPKASALAEELKKSFIMETDESHGERSGYYQLRAMNVSSIGGVALETPVSIDIGFTNRSDLAVFDTQDALTERFDGIEHASGPEARQEVIGNIILAKKLLKEGGAYKKQEHGGLGGVGVENWILQHGGNIEEAFRSFCEACKAEDGIKPLREFQEDYPIRDPGMNIKKHRHDNFILNLTETGYQNMVQVIEGYLGRP